MVENNHFLLTHETNKHKADEEAAKFKAIKTDFYFLPVNPKAVFFNRRSGNNVTNYWDRGSKVFRSVPEFAALKYSKVGLSQSLETYVSRNDRVIATFAYFCEAVKFFEERVEDDKFLPTFLSDKFKISYKLYVPGWGNIIQDTLNFNSKLDFISQVKEDPEHYQKAQQQNSACYGVCS
jgi:hypothetical protein